MPWVRLDDQFSDHPKIVRAGPAAAWLYVCALCYCARHLTDGFIPAAQVKQLVDLPSQQCHSVTQALLAAKLWEKTRGGYRIHDYLQYQPSAESVRTAREKAAARQAKSRVDRTKRHADVTALRDRDVSHESHSVTFRTHPSLTESPLPSSSPPDSATPSLRSGVGRRSASASPPARHAGRANTSKTPPATTDGHPAVAAYRRITGRDPRPVVRRRIEQAMAEAAVPATALGRFELVCDEWLARGYHATNVVGMLEWFRDGIPAPPKPTRRQLVGTPPAARRDAFDAWADELRALDQANTTDTGPEGGNAHDSTSPGGPPGPADLRARSGPAGRQLPQHVSRGQG